MIEVELKIPIQNKESLVEKLENLGFTKGDFKRESDIYFDNEESEIKNSDIALRIRSCENLTTGEADAYLTYKGPKLDGVSKTRKELEVPIGDRQIGQEILVSLGYRKLYPVVKMRQYYHNEENSMTACVDSVEGLGDFMELEAVVEEANQEMALASLVEMLEKLGYSMADTIRTSYIGMLQKKQADRK